MGHLDHLRDGVDRAKGVRDVSERDEPGLEAQQDLEDVESEQAVVRDGDELEVGVLLLDEELPRDEVGVMLHLGQDDDVAARDVLAAPRIGDEVDRLRGIAGEDDLVGVGRVDEFCDRCARSLIRRGRPLADRVDTAMDVRVVRAVELVDGVDHGLRLLARRGRVEVDERVATDVRRQDRKVAPNDRRVQAAVANTPIGSCRPIGGGLRFGGQGHGRSTVRVSGLPPPVRAPAAPATPRPARRSRVRPRAGWGRTPRPRAAGRGPCRRS